MSSCASSYPTATPISMLTRVSSTMRRADGAEPLVDVRLAGRLQHGRLVRGAVPLGRLQRLVEDPLQLRRGGAHDPLRLVEPRRAPTAPGPPPRSRRRRRRGRGHQRSRRRARTRPSRMPDDAAAEAGERAAPRSWRAGAGRAARRWRARRAGRRRPRARRGGRARRASPTRPAAPARRRCRRSRRAARRAATTSEHARGAADEEHEQRRPPAVPALQQPAEEEDGARARRPRSPSRRRGTAS